MFNPPVIKPKGYAYGGLVNQPSLRPATIQTELDSLTNDLRKTNKPKNQLNNTYYWAPCKAPRGISVYPIS